MDTYYKDQLAKLTGNTAVNIKLVNSGGETNWLSLNDESATALVEWLKDNYTINSENNTIKP